jgi:hypothetical protein
MWMLTRRSLIGSALASAGCTWPLLAATQEVQLPPAVVTQPDLFLPPPNAQPSNPQASSSILQPGMRLVWFGMSASIPGERSQIVPDPDGTWVNRRTGQKYRQFDTPSASGAGYTVADVLDASGNGVLSWITSLLIHTDQNNLCTFIDANGGLSQRQDIGEFWVPPAQLAGYTDRNDAGLRVVHMPYSLGGRTYRALRVQLQSGDGWSQNTYDLDTGLLLVGSSTTSGSPTVVIGPGNQINPGAGSTMMTYTQIAASRRTNLPGPGLVYPSQIRQLRALTYSGTRGVAMPSTGVQVPPTPMQIRYDILANAGPHLTARMSVSGMPGASGVQDRLFPAGVIGSLWMSLDVLGSYGQNQAIDQDSVTGVQAVSLGRQGNVAYVALQTPLAKQSFGYDLRSGLLSWAEVRTQVGPATDIATVQLAGTQ